MPVAPIHRHCRAGISEMQLQVGQNSVGGAGGGVNAERERMKRAAGDCACLHTRDDVAGDHCSPMEERAM